MTLHEMPYDFGMDMIRTGLKSQQRDYCWNLYCNIFPFMTKETFVSFDKFMQELTKPAEPKHTKEEILDKTRQILQLHFSKG